MNSIRGNYCGSSSRGFGSRGFGNPSSFNNEASQSNEGSLTMQTGGNSGFGDSRGGDVFRGNSSVLRMRNSQVNPQPRTSNGSLNFSGSRKVTFSDDTKVINDAQNALSNLCVGNEFTVDPIRVGAFELKITIPNGAHVELTASRNGTVVTVKSQSEPVNLKLMRG